MNDCDITYAIPCRNYVKECNALCQIILLETGSRILIIDDCSDLPNDQYLNDHRISIIKNCVKQGIVSSWNQLVENAETEYIVICTHKIRPRAVDFSQMKHLLEQKYALVALYSFGFFGFSKHLFSVISPFDNGFTDSNFEDDDTYNELFAHNLAFYCSLETPYINSGTTWKQGWYPNKTYYDSKWITNGNELIQLRSKVNESDAVKYSKFKTIDYMPFEKSVIRCDWLKKYNHMKYCDRRP